MNILTKLLVFLALMVGIDMNSVCAQVPQNDVSDDSLCEQMKPLVEFYKKDQLLYIQKEIVDVANWDEKQASRKKIVLRLAALGSLFMAFMSGGCSLMFLKHSEGLPLIAFIITAFLYAGLSGFLMCVSFEKNPPYGLKVLNMFFAFYHPSDCEFVLFNGKQKSYNLRVLIPLDLIPLFDSLYDGYKKSGIDYLKQQAPNIIGALKSWCDTKDPQAAIRRALSDLNETIRWQQLAPQYVVVHDQNHC